MLFKIKMDSDSASQVYSNEIYNDQDDEIISLTLTGEAHKQNPPELLSKHKQRPLEAHERRIGNYIVGKSIGEGTFGKVKIGIHEPTGEKVSSPSFLDCTFS